MHAMSTRSTVRPLLRPGSLIAATLAVPLALAVCSPGRAAARAAHSRGATRSAALRPVALPDGSGRIYLPAGWHITSASQGAVEAEGPQGSVFLGFSTIVWTPQAVMFARPPLVAQYGPPAEVVRQLAPQFGGRNFRLIDQKPQPWPGGQGAFVRYEVDAPHKGRQQGLGLVLLRPLGDGTFMYYSSGVSAPTAHFKQDLPVLLQIWGHWKVADHVFQQRLAHAAQSMRETGEIIRGVNARRQAAQERSNAAWDHHIRGTWVYEDTETGERHEVPNDELQPRINALNRRAGYTRYREVPYHRLRR